MTIESGQGFKNRPVAVKCVRRRRESPQRRLHSSPIKTPLRECSVHLVSFLLLVFGHVFRGMLGACSSAASETEYASPLPGLAVWSLVPAGSAGPLVSVRPAAHHWDLMRECPQTEEDEVVKDEQGPRPDREEAQQQLQPRNQSARRPGTYEDGALRGEVRGSGGGKTDEDSDEPGLENSQTGGK